MYELATGRAGVARLQLFGVIFGHNRVVIYVEPTNTQLVESNTARTQLVVAGEPLPWAEWAAEFREAMPDEIKALMGEITAGASRNDHREAIRERLRAIRELFKISRYRPALRRVQGQHETGPGAHFTQLAVTGRGQQALGEWPLFDTIALPETLALLLERFSEEAPTDEEAENMRRAARYIRTLSGATLRER